MPLEHQITEEEARALHQRFGWDPTIAGSEATSVRDVAEATGATPDDVQAYLDRIRAEQAFDAPARRRIHPLFIIGGVALAVGYLGIRVRAHYLAETTGLDPLGINRPLATYQAPARQATTSWTIYPVEEAFWPPVGFKINAVTEQIVAEAQRFPRDGEQPLPSVEESEDMLANSLMATVNKALSEQMGAKSDLPRIENLPNGVKVDYRPGFVFYSIYGWAGTKSGYIEVGGPGMTPTRSVSEQAHAIAHEIYQKGLAREREANMAPLAAVLPPPGYTVLFAGRRFDTQEGPRARFHMEPSQIREGLRKAILDAIARDRKPPTGRWDRPAAFEAKVPVPPVSRVTVYGPKGPYRFDVPTGAGPAGADGPIRKALEKMPVGDPPPPPPNDTVVPPPVGAKGTISGAIELKAR